jgi:hypothetical protein
MTRPHCSMKWFPFDAGLARDGRDRHREVSTLKTYDRRAKAFKQHAGEAFL